MPALIPFDVVSGDGVNRDDGWGRLLQELLRGVQEFCLRGVDGSSFLRGDPSVVREERRGDVWKVWKRVV